MPPINRPHIVPRLRAAEQGDAEGLAPLLAELGYPTSAREIQPRLERLLATQDVGVLIADGDDRLIGFASFQVFELIYRQRPQARLTAVAVRASHHRLGVGQALVHAVEEAVRQRGCFRIEVTTQIDRREAQAFYHVLGYEERPVRFVKMLEP